MYKDELLDTRPWLQGEWDSGWNLYHEMADPKVYTKAMNFASDLPPDAIYGNVPEKVEESFTMVKEKIEVKETKAAKLCGAYSGRTLKMDWIASLSREHGIRLIPLIVDTRASCCATNDKHAFVGPIEYGDFGEIQTADAETIMKIKGRGIARWHVIDKKG